MTKSTIFLWIIWFPCFMVSKVRSDPIYKPQFDGLLIAGISFVTCILVSGKVWMFCEVTKIIHRFCSSKGIFWSVNISFFHCIFIIYLTLFHVNNAIVLTRKTLFLHDFYGMQPLFQLSTLHKKANKVLQRWHVLAFYRIAPCLKPAFYGLIVSKLCDKLPCIWLLPLKFELTNQHS